MSLKHFQGAAYAFSQLMAEAEREIKDGARKGATVIHKRPNPAKVCIGWMKRRVLRGEFTKQA